MPDSSPREIPGFEQPQFSDGSPHYGYGAGYYVDATQKPWCDNFQMETYVHIELPEIVKKQYPQIDLSQRSIGGHSMGGGGALKLALKHFPFYKAVTAWAPRCHDSNPQSDVGIEAYRQYFGPDNTAKFKENDPVELMKLMKAVPPCLVDFGRNDEKIYMLLPDILED